MSEEKKQLLTGKSNYPGWALVTKAGLTTKKFIIKGVIQKDMAEDAVAFILQTISFPIVADLPDPEDPLAILAWLQAKYGNNNRYDNMILYRNVKMVGIDAEGFLSTYDTALARVKASGGKVDADLEMTTLLTGCHQIFYTDFIRKTLLTYKNGITSRGIVQLRIDLVEHHDATPPEARRQYAVAARQNHANSARFEDRHCDICEQAGKHWRVKTHNTNKHDDNYKPKGLRKNSGNAAVGGGEDAQIKEVQAYYDSAANLNFFKDRPSNCLPIEGMNVSTASGEKIPIVGKGTIRFGSLDLPEVYHTPGFKSNLVSGTDLMRRGFKAVIDQGKLTISKDEKVVATGTYDAQVDMIKMDNTIVEPSANASSTLSKLDPVILHQRFGHANPAMIKKTLEAGGEDINLKDFPTCEVCVTAKSRQQNIPKVASNPPRNVLEVIEIDLQGPFPRLAQDGSKMNIKMIDGLSGYVKMETLPDKMASTVTEVFKRFQRRMERRTDKKIKIVRTDGGTEFAGEFLSYLEEQGIVKQKGGAYIHHVPGKAERVHQSITRVGRALLLASYLPTMFYADAQLTASYIHNRTIHSGQTKTPYEFIYGRPSTFLNFRVFGSICFAFIPSEKRDKLEPVREKCRMLGYADDDDTEEMKGYKLLCEKDGSILYSTDVIFKEDLPMIPLEGLVPFDGEDVFGTVYVPTENFSEYAPSTVASDQSTPPPASNTDIDENSDTEEDRRQDAILADLDSRHDWNVNPIADMALSLAAANAAHYSQAQDYTPNNYKQALACPDAALWKSAMDKEMGSLDAAGTWEETLLPTSRKTIKCRWVYRIKHKADGSIDKYKARLVAKGFTQKYGIDYQETFSPVAKLKSIRSIIAIAASKGWTIKQGDVPTAFLNSDVKEEVYMDLPEGYSSKSISVARLRKALYGLKQAPREWYLLLRKFVLEQGFIQSKVDTCIYILKTATNHILCGIYVDDIIVTGVNFDEFCSSLEKKFGMEAFELLAWYLGINVKRQEDGSITLDQNNYIQDKIEEFQQFLPLKGASTQLPADYMTRLAGDNGEAEKDFPYSEMIGSLMYAMNGTRPDLAFPLSILCSFMKSPTKVHCDLIRHLFSYLRFNSFKLVYNFAEKLILQGWADASYANNLDYKSSSGYCMAVGGSLLSWSSGKQPVIAQSTAESELISANNASREVIWWKMLLGEMGFPQETVTVWEDNKACILLASNPQNHKRTKHIQVRYYYIRDLIEAQEIKLLYCSTLSQLADSFTKILPGHQLRVHLSLLGLKKIQNQRGN